MFTRNRLFLIIQILLVGVLLFSLYKIGVWLFENHKTKEVLEEVEQYIEVVEDENEDSIDIKVDFESLKELNEDTVAYLKVGTTNVDYPVVQTTNNDYYLYRSFDKSYSHAGWIFADYKNILDGNDRNLILYGHNRLDGSMFGSLSDIWDKKLYEDESNRLITFITEDKYYEYEIFSIYSIDVEEYYITTDFSDNEYSAFLDTLVKRSFYDFGSVLTIDDRILTLSTCTESDDERFVIHAKVVNS